MSYISLDISKPAFFLIIGEFTYDGSWEHPTTQHQSDFELILVNKGNLPLLINDRPFLAAPNTVLLIPPHAKVSGNGKLNQKIDFYWLHFYCDYQISQSLKSSGTDQVTLPSIFQIQNKNDILILLSELMNMEIERESNQVPLNFLTSAVISKLSIDYQNKKRSYTLSPLVHQSLEWIRANISAGLTIQNVAEHFGVSNAYLTQQFKKNIQLTPLQHLQKIKIQTAKVLLIRTNLPIYEISENSYFKTEKNFMRIFKKQTGLTPLSYRKHFSYQYQNNPFVDPRIPIPRKIQEKYDIKYK
jgi:AraC-like DNA-binding protein